jgi:hypothetical protein
MRRIVESRLGISYSEERVVYVRLLSSARNGPIQ